MGAKSFTLVMALAVIVITVTSASADQRVELTGCEIDVNTANGPELWITLQLSQSIDDGASFDSNSSSGFSADIRFVDDPDVFNLITTYKPAAVVFIYRNQDSLASLVKRIYDGTTQTWIEPSRDLPLVLEGGSPAMLHAATIREYTRGKFQMTEAQRDMLAETRATGRLTEEDRVDISKEVDNEDTTSAEYIADFHFSQPVLGSYFSLGINGRLSTRKENPLNRMEVYFYRPLTRDSALGSRFVYDLFVEASAEGTQTLDTSTLSLEAGITALTPNIVNLTAGANRLRLKPVFTLGLNYVRHLRKQSIYGHADESFAVTLDLYYYIPVADKFALIYIGEGSYNNKRRIDDRLNFRNAITFAYDLPLKDLKAIFKWETGKNDFISDTEAQAMIGILMNYISH